MTASDKTKDGGSSAVADTHRATETPVVSGHTPGPWGRYDDGGRTASGVCYGPSYADCVWGPAGPGHGLVADCSPSGQAPNASTIANARLIAAAPDLLEAALAVEALWEGDRAAAKEAGLDFDEEQAWASPVGVVWKQLRAAIAKATTAAETVSVGMSEANAPSLPTGDA